MRDEARTEWIQFIPVIERVNPDGLNLIQMGDHISSRSVQPEQFGRFLIQVFDEWVHNDVGKVFVQTFEATLRNWMGLPRGCVSSNRLAVPASLWNTTETCMPVIILSNRTTCSVISWIST